MATLERYKARPEVDGINMAIMVVRGFMSAVITLIVESFQPQILMTNLPFSLGKLQEPTGTLVYPPLQSPFDGT